MNAVLDIEQMLKAQTIAVVGLSEDPAKPSNFVSRYLQEAGKTILPVNPSLNSVLGVICYALLADLPSKPDVVNVFRLPKAIPGIVDEMIALGLQNLWVQQGIRNEDAATKAESAGIRVVMDRCIMVEHRMRMR